MRQYLFSHVLIAGSYITLMFSSCIGPAISDPYIVAQSRQEENYYYAPSSHNTPMLKEKNDISFSVQRSVSSMHSGIELQGAYLPAKHIGIISSFSSGGNKKDHDLNYDKLELGAGYILSVGKRWHFEAYGGFGGGKIDNEHYTGRSVIKSNYFFVQPAIAVSNENQTVQFGFVSKLTGNHFNVAFDGFDKDREPYSASQVQLLKDEPFHIFWEPGIVFRFGWKNCMFHTGYSISADLTRAELHRPKDNFSLGMYLTFNAGK